MKSRISVPKEKIAVFCRKRGIRWIAIFGSALRPDFGEESDIDVLVEFKTDHVPGLLGLVRMESELSSLFDGRKIDLRTPEDLSPYFRQQVIEEAEVQYAEK